MTLIFCTNTVQKILISKFSLRLHYVGPPPVQNDPDFLHGTRAEGVGNIMQLRGRVEQVRVGEGRVV